MSHDHGMDLRSEILSYIATNPISHCPVKGITVVQGVIDLTQLVKMVSKQTTPELLLEMRNNLEIQILDLVPLAVDPGEMNRVVRAKNRAFYVPLDTQYFCCLMPGDHSESASEFGHLPVPKNEVTVGEGIK